ncbi:MAG: DUF5317 family protein, partial [Kineosporiaceae bacterium]
MIVPLATVVAVISAFLLGGRPGRLARVRFRGAWLLLPALAAHVAVRWSTAGPGWLPLALQMAGYLAVGTIVLRNRRLPGFALIGAGAAGNATAIVANGGILPASSAALRAAGITPGNGFTGSEMVADPKLAFLGDVFAIPANWPLAGVFSIGDVLVVLGCGYAAHRVAGSWPLPAWSPAEHGHGTGRHTSPPSVRRTDRRTQDRGTGDRRISERREARRRAEAPAAPPSGAVPPPGQPALPSDRPAPAPPRPAPTAAGAVAFPATVNPTDRRSGTDRRGFLRRSGNRRPPPVQDPLAVMLARGRARPEPVTHAAESPVMRPGALTILPGAGSAAAPDPTPAPAPTPTPAPAPGPEPAPGPAPGPG